MSRFAIIPVLAACGLTAACATFDDTERLSAQPPIRNLGDSNARAASPNATSGPGGDLNGPAFVVSIDVPRLIMEYAGKTGTVSEKAAPLEYALATFDMQVTKPPAASQQGAAAAQDPLPAATPTIDAEKAQLYRNSVVGAVLYASDQNCDLYLTKVRGNQAFLRGTTSALATIFAGAASVTTPIESASILSAIGAASSGIGGNINEASFSNKTVEVIATAIRADRTKVRAVIENNMKKEYWDWPLSQALSETSGYHGRCNLLTGLGALQEAAADANKTAERNLAAAQNRVRNNSPTDRVPEL